jgi:predicted CoA-substrate-specific enzyme activase
MIKKYYGGCDVGSTTGKAAILDENGSIISTTVVPSEIDPEITSIQALEKACAQIPDLSSYKDLARIVGTGYGRNEVAFANENISEISCHAMGTFYCNRDIKTIVDIGGQDVKTIAIAVDGSVLEFAMNDKCAAGTGRFLEAMSRIFRMDLDQFSLLKRIGMRPLVTVTGGCAKNQGLIKSLSKKINLEVTPLPVDPQIIGALGAAVFARRNGSA